MLMLTVIVFLSGISTIAALESSLKPYYPQRYSQQYLFELQLVRRGQPGRKKVDTKQEAIQGSQKKSALINQPASARSSGPISLQPQSDHISGPSRGIYERPRPPSREDRTQRLQTQSTQSSGSEFRYPERPRPPPPGNPTGLFRAQTHRLSDPGSYLPQRLQAPSSTTHTGQVRGQRSQPSESDPRLRDRTRPSPSTAPIRLKALESSRGITSERTVPSPKQPAPPSAYSQQPTRQSIKKDTSFPNIASKSNQAPRKDQRIQKIDPKPAEVTNPFAALQDLENLSSSRSSSPASDQGKHQTKAVASRGKPISREGRPDPPSSNVQKPSTVATDSKTKKQGKRQGNKFGTKSSKPKSGNTSEQHQGSTARPEPSVQAGPSSSKQGLQEVQSKPKDVEAKGADSSTRKQVVDNSGRGLNRKEGERKFEPPTGSIFAGLADLLRPGSPERGYVTPGQQDIAVTRMREKPGAWNHAIATGYGPAGVQAITPSTQTSQLYGQNGEQVKATAHDPDFAYTHGRAYDNGRGGRGKITAKVTAKYVYGNLMTTSKGHIDYTGTRENGQIGNGHLPAATTSSALQVKPLLENLHGKMQTLEATAHGQARVHLWGASKPIQLSLGDEKP